jgi:threonine/homoserine/homoserine lactone efflux protein
VLPGRLNDDWLVLFLVGVVVLVGVALVAQRGQLVRVNPFLPPWPAALIGVLFVAVGLAVLWMVLMADLPR